MDEPLASTETCVDTKCFIHNGTTTQLSGGNFHGTGLHLGRGVRGGKSMDEKYYGGQVDVYCTVSSNFN